MTTQPQPFLRQIDDATVVTVRQLLTQLQTQAIKSRWPIERIARAAGLPKSIVYRAMQGENCTLKTLQAIAHVFNGEVVVMIRKTKR